MTAGYIVPWFPCLRPTACACHQANLGLWRDRLRLEPVPAWLTGRAQGFLLKGPVRTLGSSTAALILRRKVTASLPSDQPVVSMSGPHTSWAAPPPIEKRSQQVCLQWAEKALMKLGDD